VAADRSIAGMRLGHLRVTVPAAMLVLAAGCTSGSGNANTSPTAGATSTATASATLAPPPATSDIATLSSEFNTAQGLAGWTDLRATEGGPNWVKRRDVNTTVPGSLYLVPDVCGWYGSYRGVLLYREVSGDAVLHLRLRAQGASAEFPSSIFSLGGAMLRVPEKPGSATRTGEASWAFITVGSGDRPRQVETKTTAAGISDLVLHPSQTGWNEVILARIGPAVLTAYRQGDGPWQVMSRWRRADLPAKLQWGIAAYTDWLTFSSHPSAQANAQIWPGHPDLRLSVDYARFYRPAPPPAGVDLTDPQAVNDAAILTAITVPG
jgi:hypothetical protein